MKVVVRLVVVATLLSGCVHQVPPTEPREYGWMADPKVDLTEAMGRCRKSAAERTGVPPDTPIGVFLPFDVLNRRCLATYLRYEELRRDLGINQ